MNWDAILLDEVLPGTDLARPIDALFAHARANWAAFRDAEAALAQVDSTQIFETGSRIIVQSNAGRRKSTHAKVDAKSIASRPCFLCPDNLPAQERGIAFGNLVVLPNPYPVLRRHCTIPSRDHAPQQLTGRIGTMFDLARAVGSDMLVYYNGPRCGASAPDHFHFQAGCAAGVPILDETRESGNSDAWNASRSFGRCTLVRVDRDAAVARKRIEQLLIQLRNAPPNSEFAAGEEPMVNLIVCYRNGQFTSVVFPRAAHRPACYAAEGTAQIAVSPATLEMAGILVVAEPDQFNRVDAAVTRQIYQEVSLDEVAFGRLVKEIIQ